MTLYTLLSIFADEIKINSYQPERKKEDFIKAVEKGRTTCRGNALRCYNNIIDNLLACILAHFCWK
jgi:hypothetical protein